MKIKEVSARKIINSKGDQTIEVEVNGFISSIGNGTSTGKFEVNALPSNIDNVVRRFNTTITKNIINMSFNSFEDLDKVERVIRAEDFSNDFRELGGNLLVDLQLAILKAVSEGKVYELLGGKKLPLPVGNIIGGGKHAGVKSPDIQEFLIIPRAKTIEDAVFANVSFHSMIREKIAKIDKNFNFGRNIEGAWCPALNNYEILDLLKKNKEKIEKEFKLKIDLGIDMAASGLWNGRMYQYKNFSRFSQKRVISRKEQIAFVRKLINNYDLKYVEDPLHEEDFEGFKELKGSSMIVGDDLTATNIERLKQAEGCINAVIVKPNQIGSLLKVKQVIDYAKSKKIKIIVSHRSGETEDNILSHLAVGWGADYIKTGIEGARISKLNELLRISDRYSKV